ncbi:MAG: CopD family protein [Phycisphaerales bacterium]|jgi:putative copper export protein|nr:CopD family protein [Planctomycetota bacterium]
MLTKLLVIFHVLGASVWVGGHIVLLVVTIPSARRRGEVAPIREFEAAFSRVGLVALLVQVATGFALASRWVGEWRSILSSPNSAAHLVLTKLGLLALIVGLGTHASRRIVPGLTIQTLPRFVRHAWLVTGLSVALVICGVSVRFGGLL